MKSAIIIGGGAAGIMTAITAKKHNPNLDVSILEANDHIGRKIKISGAGRCNFSNASIKAFHYHGATSKFIGTVINQFKSDDILNFFKDLGVEYFEERKDSLSSGKIFPVTNDSDTILELLEEELTRQQVKVYLSTKVEKVVLRENKFIVSTDKCKFKSDFLVVATGGMSYPKLGGNDIGYKIACQFNHTIIKPVPSGVPLIIDHPIFKKLAGIRMDVELGFEFEGDIVKTASGELLFTKYGLSGPVIFDISREISIKINRENKNNCILTIDFFPNQNRDELYDMLLERWSRRPDQKILYSLYGLIKNKVARYFLDFLEIDKDNPNSSLSKFQERKIVDNLHCMKVKIKATKDWDLAEFTAGGINTREISEYTMESKIIPGLYFVGEVMNVDGDIGGFNLAWAWSTGWVAGKSI